jgi:anti-sigma factor RsiW
VLVSDRLDGELNAAGAARLDAHLANCPRCSEHEQRLVRAQDRLVTAFGRAGAETGPAPLALVTEEGEPEQAGVADGLVAVSLAVILTLSALLVIAAIAFAVAALLP